MVELGESGALLSLNFIIDDGVGDTNDGSMFWNIFGVRVLLRKELFASVAWFGEQKTQQNKTLNLLNFIQQTRQFFEINKIKQSEKNVNTKHK